MKPKVILIGGGGQAKVLISAIQASNAFEMIGILDPKLKSGEKVFSIPVLGDDAYLNKVDPSEISLCLAIGQLKGDHTRSLLIEKYRSFSFINVIHPSAILPNPTTYGSGCQIMAGAIFQPQVTLGNHVIINTGAIIEHDCKIASHSHIAPGAVLGGGVQIGENTMVGLGARILPNLKIGNHVTVGAGSVVVCDIPDGKIVKGIPAL